MEQGSRRKHLSALTHPIICDYHELFLCREQKNDTGPFNPLLFRFKADYKTGFVGERPQGQMEGFTEPEKADHFFPAATSVAPPLCPGLLIITPTGNRLIRANPVKQERP
jgi:hypothetical protein